ncbi:NrfD/PsrC family molybdoenzyme membrane anchor subunit [Chloroflexota bacterium]
MADLDINFVPVEGKSKRYYIAVAVFAVIALTGIISFIISYIAGHHTFGANNQIPWGLPIVVAIYLIGLSAGLHILAFLIYIMGHDHYKQVIRVAVFLAVILIFGAMISIGIELGRIEKMWRLFTFGYLNNMQSMLALNSIFYSCYFLSAVIYLGSLLTNKKRFSMIMGMVAFFWAMATHGGTGAIFGFISSREPWFSPLSPFEFILAAFVSSIALLVLVLLIIFKTTNRPLRSDIVSSLGGLLKIFLICLIIVMVIGELTHLYSPEREGIMFMITGPYSWAFWILQVGMGIVIPMVILFHPKTKGSNRYIVAACISVVIGVFVKRLYLVIAGLAYPQHYYPGEIEGIWGQVGSYSLAPVEILLCIGIFGLLALLYTVGLKFMDLLPERVEAEPVAEPVIEESAAPQE